MTITTTDSSATERETPHSHRTTRTNAILNTLKRRVQAILNDKSIDAESRAIIRYGLEVNTPWLADLVRRAEAGERISTTGTFQPLKSDSYGADYLKGLKRCKWN